MEDTPRLVLSLSKQAKSLGNARDRLACPERSRRMGLLHERTPEQEESELYGERASVSKAGQSSNSKSTGVKLCG